MLDRIMIIEPTVECFVCVLSIIIDYLHIEELWGLVVVRRSVVAQWQSTGCTSQVSWVRFPAAAGLFTFLYFCLITSKLLFNGLSTCAAKFA